MNHLLIYADRTSNRLTYIFDFILGELLGLTYELTNSRDKFLQYEGAKFSYASQPAGDELFFETSQLLFETNIVPQPITFCEHGKLVGFYLVSEKSSIPFDFFASAFFMLSCYNEYLPSKKDKYERYRSSQSMNYKAGFLEKPMVNNYAIYLRKILFEKFPSLVFKQNKFDYVATFDVDMAYSYLGKGFNTNLGGIVRSFLMSDFKDIRNRLLVLSGKKRDPFDTFDYLLKVCSENQIKTIFFFLLGDKSRFDKNIPFDNEKFRQLIKHISQSSEVGIHLSYKSHVSKDVMKMEMERLEEIIGEKIFRNRYHYLRFQISHSYLRLMKVGITEDYSLGYAPRAGFRAGTCSPFYYFNLKTNERTDFRIYPFAFMDTTFTRYNRINAEESLQKILQLMKYVKQAEGTLVGLWHNSSFTEEREWKGWKKVFETVAREAALLKKEP